MYTTNPMHASKTGLRTTRNNCSHCQSGALKMYYGRVYWADGTSRFAFIDATDEVKKSRHGDMLDPANVHACSVTWPPLDPKWDKRTWKTGG